MNNRQAYQSSVNTYSAGVQLVKKLGTAGLMIQVGIIGFVNGWKYLGAGYYEISAPILFSLSVYLFIKDFIILRRIEENMARMILDGVDFEKKNPSVGEFFHGLLQSFNFTNVLVQRSLINAIAIGCLGYLIFQFISDIIFPEITISRWLLGALVWVPSVLACKLYYDSLKVLDEAKEKAFAK